MGGMEVKEYSWIMKVHMCIVCTLLLPFPGYLLIYLYTTQYNNYQWTIEDFLGGDPLEGGMEWAAIGPKNTSFVDAQLVLSKTSEEERIWMLYQHAKRLVDTVTDPLARANLVPFYHGLNVLRTRRFATVQREKSCHGCFDFNFREILPAMNVCAKAKSITLLILITSVPVNIAQRRTVRETWASHTKNNTAKQVRHVFLFGGGWNKTEQEILERESQQYKDILQEDFVDSYYNLTYKVVAGLKWALRECIAADNILRTADDNFINPRALLTLIKESKANLTTAVFGYCVPPKEPERGLTNKHSVSFLEWPRDDLYPPYCEGTAVLMSAGVARRLLLTCVDVPYFPLEDVYLGMVMERACIITQRVAGFAAGRKPEVWTKCWSYYSIHEVSGSLMRKIWATCYHGNSSKTV